MGWGGLSHTPHPSWPAPEPPQLTAEQARLGSLGSMRGRQAVSPQAFRAAKGESWPACSGRRGREEPDWTHRSPGLLWAVGACSAWAASVQVSVQMCGECGARWRGESARDDVHAGCGGVVCEAECAAPGAAALPCPASQGPGFIWPPRAPGGQGCQPPPTPLPWVILPSAPCWVPPGLPLCW